MLILELIGVAMLVALAVRSKRLRLPLALLLVLVLAVLLALRLRGHHDERRPICPYPPEIGCPDPGTTVDAGQP